MAAPPSYAESTSDYLSFTAEKRDSKTPQAWSIREQIGLSRSQHVASIVSQIVSHIRERALQGLSKTTLVLVPSDQDACRMGVLVGFADDEVPTIIQFEGRQNSMQFWSQDEALAELRMQLLNAISDDVPHTTVREELPERPAPPPKKSSWFGRKNSKAPEPVQPVRSAPPPVKVDVQMDELHFRHETEYGLYETLRARVVMAVLDVL